MRPPQPPPPPPSPLPPPPPPPHKMQSRGENKFTAFFRSRSRSRPRHTPTTPSDAMYPDGHPKAPGRPQNRPISSTTTATHSTITPLPSDSLRNRLNASRHPYAFQPCSTDAHPDHPHRPHTPSDSGDHNFPRSETPSSARRRLLFHSFFGISLSRRSSAPQQLSDRKPSLPASEPTPVSSRKRSFRFSSRPPTPKSVNDPSPYSIPVPSNPLPLSASPRRRSFGLGSSHRSTPKSSTSHLPLPHPTQSPRAHARRHSVGSERPPHDSAVALSEESSHRSLHKPLSDPRSKGKEREFSSHDPPPSFDFPSHSLPIHPSSEYPSSHSATNSAFSHLPTVDSASFEENDPPSSLPPLRSPIIPRIIHTPPTPQRPGEVLDSHLQPGTARPPIPVTTTHREHVIVSSSQSHSDPQRNPSSRARFTPRIFGGKDLPKPTRPTPDSSIQNSNTSGPPRNMSSHRSKLGSFDFERPVSALNRSNSTLNRHRAHLQKDNLSPLKSRPERTISDDSAQGAVSHPAQSEPFAINPVLTGDTSVISFSSVSVQTTSTGKATGNGIPAGQSSSWGRASGRRVLRTSHGTFAFEHSSSAPSSPNPQKFGLPNQNEALVPALPHSQPTTPLHSIFDGRAKHSRGRSYNIPDHTEPGHVKPGERKPKGKGRSLDLGLGLSWAPSRLREEVLMPGLILAREKAKLEKSKGSGLDVTKAFESILSEAQFQTFKEHVHRFDAHIIPLEGPSGLLACVENLLAESGLDERERTKLVSDFNVFVHSHAN